MAMPQALCAHFVACLILSPLSAFALDVVNPDNGKAGSIVQAPSSALAGGWRLVRSHNPNGGADAISIMHPADTTRSDLDLVGIMIRCSESDAEVVIVTLSALPFRVRPQVAFGKLENAIKFEATVAPPGTLVLLPKEATGLVNGPWQSLEDLFVEVDYDQSTIRGVVKIAGLEGAFKNLTASCPPR
jgi:hypothetical protein